MGYREELQQYAEKMSYKYALFHRGKMAKTLIGFKRYVSREINGERNLQITSQDLRSFAMAVTKELKALQKKVEFDKFKKEFEKHKKVDALVWIEECKKIQEKLNLAMDLQPIALEANYYAVVVEIIEILNQKQKEEDDEIFNHEVLAGLLELF